MVLMHKLLFPDERTALLKRHGSEKDRKIDDRIKIVLWADDGWRFRQISRSLFIDVETVRCHFYEYEQLQKFSNASGSSALKLN